MYTHSGFIKKYKNQLKLNIFIKVYVFFNKNNKLGKYIHARMFILHIINII